MYSLYQKNDDGSKILIDQFPNLAAAEAAMTNPMIVYSIEYFDGQDWSVIL